MKLKTIQGIRRIVDIKTDCLPLQPNHYTEYKRKRPMSGRRDSNPLPTAWEAVALPGELLPLVFGSYRPDNSGPLPHKSNLRNCIWE